ncbi:polysaccharide biosynthesis/export family protein [Cyanobium sp. ATX 6F1]|nr:polysaccharide biosynthesis/export family protein [Cyanobium sp. ATX 6F1]
MPSLAAAAIPSPAAPVPSAAASPQRSRVVYDTYIVGPGDTLQIELLDIPEFSGSFSIGPDGTLYLPRLRALYVEGLTIEELRYFLTQQFKAYVRKPEIYIRPLGYRAVRVYVGGEVKRPGFFTLSGVQNPEVESPETSATEATLGPAQTVERSLSRRGIAGGSSSLTLFPTLFDAIRTAQGITPYSDLSQVTVTRRQPVSAGGGKVRAQVNFLSLITEGDETQNIRLFDGDVVNVSKSPIVLREQLLKAGQTNLSPQFLQVYVSGRVKIPGPTTLPQGSSLNQAIVSAGGLKLLHGKVEFVRFTREGEIDRRQFKYSPNAPLDAPNNPVLMAGDIIRINDSALSGSIEVLNEFAGPFVGAYSVYSIFK